MLRFNLINSFEALLVLMKEIFHRINVVPLSFVITQTLPNLCFLGRLLTVASSGELKSLACVK